MFCPVGLAGRVFVGQVFVSNAVWCVPDNLLLGAYCPAKPNEMQANVRKEACTRLKNPTH